MNGSWRTTVTAIAAAIASVAMAVRAFAEGDAIDFEGVQDAVIAALIAVGLYNARDNKVTSRQAGAEPSPLVGKGAGSGLLGGGSPKGRPPSGLLGLLFFAIFASLIASTNLVAQPKAPDLIIGAGDEERTVSIEWANPFHVLPDYVRVDSVVEPGIVAQGFASKTHLLVDVFNVGAGPVRIAFAGVVGDEGEFDRVVPPSAGIAWSSSPPTVQFDDPGSGRWDEVFAPSSWDRVDIGWTFQTGSSRNKFESRQLWMAEKDRVSRSMEQWLDRWVRWQLHRTYQDPDPVRGFPRVLLGQAPAGGEWAKYPGLGTVTPMDTHHQTVGVLRDAYVLTRNPRALDQLTREMRWSYAGQDYYRPDWHWPYGGSERVPGWLLNSLADSVETWRAAGLSSFVEWGAMAATDHVDLLTTLGFNELDLPNVVNAPDPGRHLGVPHNLPWQGATVAFGLLRVDEEIGVPGAAEQAELWLDYLERYGWNGDPNNGIAYDSVAHDPENAHIAPRAAGVPGIGDWAAAPLLKAGRDDSGYLAFILGKVGGVKYSGNLLLSPKGFPGTFARAIDWSE